jgi:hypothetical protein
MRPRDMTINFNRATMNAQTGSLVQFFGCRKKKFFPLDKLISKK